MQLSHQNQATISILSMSLYKNHHLLSFIALSFGVDDLFVVLVSFKFRERAIVHSVVQRVFTKFSSFVCLSIVCTLSCVGDFKAVDCCQHDDILLYHI